MPLDRAAPAESSPFPVTPTIKEKQLAGTSSRRTREQLLATNLISASDVPSAKAARPGLRGTVGSCLLACAQCAYAGLTHVAACPQNEEVKEALQLCAGKIVQALRAAGAHRLRTPWLQVALNLVQRPDGRPEVGA